MINDPIKTVNSFLIKYFFLDVLKYNKKPHSFIESVENVSPPDQDNSNGKNTKGKKRVKKIIAGRRK